jgi:hypothetical protein
MRHGRRYLHRKAVVLRHCLSHTDTYACKRERERERERERARERARESERAREREL